MGRGRHQRRAYLPKLTGGRKCLLSGETSALSALSKTGNRARSPLMVSARVRGPSFRKYLHPPPCPLTPRTNGSENTLKVFAYPPLSNQCIKAAKSFCCSILSSSRLISAFRHFGSVNCQHKAVFGTGEVSHPPVLKCPPIKKEGRDEWLDGVIAFQIGSEQSSRIGSEKLSRSWERSSGQLPTHMHWPAGEKFHFVDFD